MVTAVDGIHFETRHWPFSGSASPSKERFPQPDATLVQLPFSDTQKAAQFQTAAVDNDENNQIVKVEISGARAGSFTGRGRPTNSAVIAVGAFLGLAVKIAGKIFIGCVRKRLRRRHEAHSGRITGEK